MARIVLIGPVTATADKPPESGVAAYLGELITSLTTAHQVTVLAQNDAVSSQIGFATVRGTWAPTQRAALQIGGALARLSPDVVHLQHEFNLYGGQLPTAEVTATVGACRLAGRRVLITVHGVVDPADVTQQLVRDNYLPGRTRSVKMAFQAAYRFLSASSTTLIVHHRHFGDVLHRCYGIPWSKIAVVPLGYAPPKGSHPSADAVALSSHPVARDLKVLVLGFLTGYKAPEAVADLADSDILPGAQFQFCVGKNPRIAAPAYLERYERLRSRVAAIGAPRAQMRGYVPDEDLPGILRSADVLCLPYSRCLAATAVAGLALRYRLPICFSTQLAPILGDGPTSFRLGDRASLAAAITAAVTGRRTLAYELFAPWKEVAAMTEGLWANA